MSTLTVETGTTQDVIVVEVGFNADLPTVIETVFNADQPQIVEVEIPGLPGPPGISHAFTTINTDSSRPVAYWGYKLLSTGLEYIAKLDYTAGGQPVVTRAQVTSVASEWANRQNIIYS